MPEKYRRPHHHERVQTVERMQREWEAQRDALATVRRFNARLSAKRSAWFWPKIADFKEKMGIVEVQIHPEDGGMSPWLPT